MLTPLLTLAAIFFALVYVGMRLNVDRKHKKKLEAALQEYVGRRAIVIQSVDRKTGQVRINGEGYPARTEDGDAHLITPRVLVEVIGVMGRQLVVRKVQGQARLVDVDEIVSVSKSATGGNS